MKRMNGYRAEELINPDALISRQRLVVPVWATLLGALFRGLWRFGWFLARHWRITLPTLFLATLWARLGWPALLALVLVLASAAGIWWRLHPASFGRFVGAPVWGQFRLVTVYRRGWRRAMIGSGLAVHHAGGDFLPVIHSARSTRWADTITVRLLNGQTPELFAKNAERLRHVFGAYRCTARELAPGTVTVRFYSRDPLTVPIPALPVPEVLNLRALPLGRSEETDSYALDLFGTHLLIAGATGSGKGSVIWSLLRALAPGIKDGSVQVWAIDPKGGMELIFGRDQFTRYEDTNFPAMADLLEDAVTGMQTRASRLKGTTRQHVPTPGDPLVIVLVDELAALTSYATDRDVKKRVAAALSLLLSQGRAPGYQVVAALQDPRKEVLPFRDLFPTRIALRLSEESQVDMTLGDGMRDRGALADQIPRTLPGVGYVTHETSPDPIRVRIAYVTDEDIQATAASHPAPSHARRWSGQNETGEAAA